MTNHGQPLLVMAKCEQFFSVLPDRWHNVGGRAVKITLRFEISTARNILLHVNASGVVLNAAHCLHFLGAPCGGGRLSSRGLSRAFWPSWALLLHLDHFPPVLAALCGP